MALSNFLRINLPYGIQFNTLDNKWCFFNREYLPLGETDFSKKKDDVLDLISLPYNNLNVSDVSLIFKKYHKKLNVFCNDFTLRDGRIKFYFYNDGCVPSNNKTFKLYFDVLEEICNLAKDDFFEINFPMGIGFTKEKKCFLFNRYFLPLGIKNESFINLVESSKLAVKYKKFTQIVFLNSVIKHQLNFYKTEDTIDYQLIYFYDHEIPFPIFQTSFVGYFKMLEKISNVII